MNESHIIGIDTGNRCIKTANHVFVSGIKSSAMTLPFDTGVLIYNNRYHMLSQSRVSYMQDKTETDEYFVLALYAIARELHTRGINVEDIVPVELGVGLPPAHISRLKERFKKYFSRGIVSFSLDNTELKLDIRGVSVFPQGYAAIFRDFTEVSKLSHSYIIDIGGYTTDIISLSKGVIDPDFCESLDMGMIHLYNRILSSIRRKYGNAPTEGQIDEILVSSIELDAVMPVVTVINREADAVVKELVRRLNEYGINLNFSRGIFIGGGALRLRKWIEQSHYISAPYFITDIRANARGYKAFIKAMRHRDNEETY